MSSSSPPPPPRAHRSAEGATPGSRSGTAAETARASSSKPRRTAPSFPSSSSATSPESSHLQSSTSPPTSHSSPLAPDPAGSDTGSAGPSGPTSRKRRVQLAPDQPPTTRGKPRERVFVACVQCRSRKVRCDGGKPECFNCTRRADQGVDPCSYDAAPRRRGKDRTPGSRKLAPYIPKKTRTTRSRLEEEARSKRAIEPGPSRLSEPLASTSASPRIPPTPVPPNPTPPGGTSLPVSAPISPFEFDIDPSLLQPNDFDLTNNYPGPGFTVVPEAQRQGDEEQITILISAPSVQFTRETWWDALLALYAAPPDVPNLTLTVTGDMRTNASERIAGDLRFLFQVSLHWFSFINIPRFFASLFNPILRRGIQPSLILSALGLATFFQSSEAERGHKGREKALRLIDQAHATFNASVASGWIDVGLVQAAWLLAIFEIQAHPKLTRQRTHEAMATLDSLIRYLSLTTLDVDDARATVFVPHAVPIVQSGAPPIVTSGATAYDPSPHTLLTYSGSEQTSTTLAMADSVPPGKWHCGCQAYSLKYHWPVVQDLAPQWGQMPRWPKDIDEGEMRKEECRRLVWSSVMLAATQSTKSTAGTDWEPQHLWIKDPANYALLFPGENLAPPGTSPVATSKDSVWSLYMRTLLLWHSCLRMRCDTSLCDADRAQYAMGAWLEIDAIEATLDRHSCTVESGFLVQVRDILFNTRMCVSHEFQRYIPEATTAPGQLFYHAKAEQWMTHQLYVASYFAQSLRNPQVNPDDHSRRNFLMFWFMSQITRALALWDADHTLSVALEVARTFAPATEYLMLLWPSAGPRREYEKLRVQLVQTCDVAGVSPPERAIGYEGMGLV
ncbi:hypothetical protein BD413DRAFT_575275 [Trametes elegans]|nr:hypothetical protein BD413DRAFT_575275 [Trametes elegans]